MTPDEFILRSIDAGVRANKLPPDTFDGYHSIFTIAHMLSLQERYITFRFLEYDFEILSMNFQEIINISVSMNSDNSILSASLSASRYDSKKHFFHWEEKVADETDMALLTISTNYRKNKDSELV